VGRTKITAAMMTTTTSAGFHESSFKALFLSYSASWRAAIHCSPQMPMAGWFAPCAHEPNALPRGGHRPAVFSDPSEPGDQILMDRQKSNFGMVVKKINLRRANLKEGGVHLYTAATSRCSATQKLAFLRNRQA
jgi:hypothetical protein